MKYSLFLGSATQGIPSHSQISTTPEQSRQACSSIFDPPPHRGHIGSDPRPRWNKFTFLGMKLCINLQQLYFIFSGLLLPINFCNNPYEPEHLDQDFHHQGSHEATGDSQFEQYRFHHQQDTNVIGPPKGSQLKV